MRVSKIDSCFTRLHNKDMSAKDRCLEVSKQFLASMSNLIFGMRNSYFVCGEDPVQVETSLVDDCTQVLADLMTKTDEVLTGNQCVLLPFLRPPPPPPPPPPPAPALFLTLPNSLVTLHRRRTVGKCPVWQHNHVRGGVLPAAEYLHRGAQDHP